MNRNRTLIISGFDNVWRQTRLLLVMIIFLVISANQPTHLTASALLQDDNRIILPADGQITVNFIGTGGLGEPTACEGDFGLHSPQQVLIYPEYLYNAGVSFTIPDYFPQGVELVFYITPRDFCSGGTYLSTDPNRAHVTHPDANTWIIGWEDWADADFNDLIVQIDFKPVTLPFLDLPYNYSGSIFANESRDTEQGGKVNAYFDHQYPTYCSFPNIGGCSSTDTRAVNFYGYDGTQTNPPPPYRVVYNGHDGSDYLLAEGTPVLAATSGTVSFADGIPLVCGDGQTRTANVIKIQHSNGYVTEYWHLSAFATDISVGSPVVRDPSHPIGYVGNTGCSDGPHLHFLVRNPSGIVIDPYGWMPLPDSAFYSEGSPWQIWNVNNGGADAASHYLWIHQLATTTLLSSSSTTVMNSASGNVVASFPVGIYNTALRMQMVEGLPSANVPGYKGLYSFSLFGYSVDDVPVLTLSGEVSLSVHIPVYGLQTLSAMTTIPPTLHVWDPQSSTWQKLSTTWDSYTGNVHAFSSQIGTFAFTIPENHIYLPLVFTH